MKEDPDFLYYRSSSGRPVGVLQVEVCRKVMLSLSISPTPLMRNSLTGTQNPKEPEPMNTKKSPVQKLLNKMGVQVKKYPDKDLCRRLKIMKHHHINVLFDIGAATGEYALKMRELGYAGKIISFEPLQQAFDVLSRRAAGDPKWEVCHHALGQSEGKALINVAGNSDSSSLLDMLHEHESSEPSSRYVRQEEICVKTVDSVFHRFCSNRDEAMLKLDVQGFEKMVLEGAKETLSRVRMIQMELSIVPLYESQELFYEMICYLKEKGFELFSLENGFENPETGRLLQVDGLFVRPQ